MNRMIIPLALILALTGCDDTDIGRIDRRSFLTAPELVAEIGDGALLVEVHGLPWADANSSEVVSTLRMPEGPARALRFQEVPAGQGHIGGGNRLVLRFNPARMPNANEDCRATSPLPVEPPKNGEFTVNATFCKQLDWQIRIFAKASVNAEDWLAYYLAMERVLKKMFPNQ